MGRTRHSQSCQTKGYFSYAERNGRTMAYTQNSKSGIALDADTGTMRARVGTDSHRQFDNCWICSQQCEDPVCTPEGMLYCRLCIMQHMTTQKAELKKKLQVYEAQQATSSTTQATKEDVLQSMKEATHNAVQDSILPTTGEQVSQEIDARTKAIESEVENEGVKAGRLSSFWLATSTPEYSKKTAEKPDTTVRDPFNKKPLRLKHLRGVKWTEENDDAGKGTNRFLCPISRNSFKGGAEIVIMPDGLAVNKKSLKEALKGDGPTFSCPFSGDSLLKTSLIHLVKSGTSFAASTAGQDVGGAVAEVYRPSLSMAIS